MRRLFQKKSLPTHFFSPQPNLIDCSQASEPPETGDWGKESAWGRREGS